MSKDDDRLMHHEYDGIQEYDNPLPFWWKGLFVLTAAHAAAYFAWYHLGGPGWTEEERYAADVKELEARRAAVPAAAVVVDETVLASMAKDPGVIERGHGVFAKNCVSCHSDQGQGLVGPNLTDAFQIHGATRLDLYTTIQNGVPDKGMLSWGPLLPPDELAAVAAFVTTLRGTDVPGGKTAEGKSVEKFQ